MKINANTTHNASMILAGPGPADPTVTFVLIGDSYSFYLGDAFRDRLVNVHGEVVDYHNFGISGSNADNWLDGTPTLNGETPDYAGALDIIANPLVPNPIVYLTMGGNDLAESLVRHDDTAAWNVLADSIKDKVQIMIDDIYNANPSARVILGSYLVLSHDTNDGAGLGLLGIQIFYGSPGDPDETADGTTLKTTWAPRLAALKTANPSLYYDPVWWDQFGTTPPSEDLFMQIGSDNLHPNEISGRTLVASRMDILYP